MTVALSVALAVMIGAPQRAWASVAPGEEQPEPGPSLPSVEDEPGSQTLPNIEGPDRAPSAEPGPAPSLELNEASNTKPAAGTPPPPTLQQPVVVRVAVGLSAELDGDKAELELLDQLEDSARRSADPSTDVRRLRVGSVEAKELCREGRDDLIINIGHVPDRDEPVLLSYDCRIDEALGIRAAEAAQDPDLLGVLWVEHNQRVADGARERRRARISPKARTGIIAGAAILVIGAAVSLLIIGAVQRESVVLVISPGS